MRWIVIALLSFIWSLQVKAQGAPVEGATITGNLVLGRYIFALPPGDWKVVSVSSGNVTVETQTQGATTQSAYLVQVDPEGRFVAAHGFNVPLTSSAVRRWTDNLCDRNDTLHRHTFAGRFDFPECLLINHYVGFWASAPSNPVDRKIWDWYQRNGVKMPKTAIMAQYRNHFAGDYVRLTMAVNPEVFGQSPSVKTAWAESEWHPLVIKNDPQRLAFVDSFKKWSYIMAENASATLVDRKPKVPSLPSLDDLKVTTGTK